MNQKITLSDLTDEIAVITGKQKQQVEALLRELFSLISESLIEGDKIKIKKLGTFKAIEVEQRRSIDVNTGEEIVIPSYRKVTFTPDKELAEAVNLPFSAFETVEISDNVTDEMLDNVGEETNNNDLVANEVIKDDFVVTNEDVKTEAAPLEESRQEQEIVGDNHFEGMPSIQWEENDDEAIENSAEDLSQPKVAPIAADSNENLSDEETDEDNLSSDEEDIEDEDMPAPKNGFAKGFLLGVASMLAIVVIGIAAWWMIDKDNFPIRFTASSQSESEYVTEVAENSVDVEIKAESSDAIAQEQTESEASTPIGESEKEDNEIIPATVPSDRPVYDTISRTRFLTTMARDHYGNYHLWPYIYEENKAILGHPDRIRPGTKVVIPPAEKYGIDADNAECIAKAKRKGAEIYSRYK